MAPYITTNMSVYACFYFHGPLCQTYTCLVTLLRRYRKLVYNAQQFLISQFGLSFFIWQPETSSYVSKTFNFFIFPRPFQDFDRRFMCQASSLDFLASQGFDFNKFIYDGIPFLPLHLKDKKLAALQMEQAASGRPTTEAGKILVEEMKAEVSSWLASGDKQLQLQLKSCSLQDRAAQMVSHCTIEAYWCLCCHLRNCKF